MTYKIWKMHVNTALFIHLDVVPSEVDDYDWYQSYSDGLLPSAAVEVYINSLTR